MNTPNDWARFFKLHNCINNPRFAEQVRLIQNDAINSVKENKNKTKSKEKHDTNTSVD